MSDFLRGTFYSMGALAISYEGVRASHTAFLQRFFRVGVTPAGTRTVIRTNLPSSGKIATATAKRAFRGGQIAAKLGARATPPTARFLGRSAVKGAGLSKTIAKGAFFGGKLAANSRLALAIGKGLGKASPFLLAFSLGLGAKGAIEGIKEARTAESGLDAFLAPVKGFLKGFLF